MYMGPAAGGFRPLRGSRPSPRTAASPPTTGTPLNWP